MDLGLMGGNFASYLLFVSFSWHEFLKKVANQNVEMLKRKIGMYSHVNAQIHKV